MGIDYGIINHTKKQYLEFDRRLHDWHIALAEWLCKNWVGDHLEIGYDTGGRLQEVREQNQIWDGKDPYKMVDRQAIIKAWEDEP